jgi:Tol biopolymer transport system component
VGRIIPTSLLLVLCSGCVFDATGLSADAALLDLGQLQDSAHPQETGLAGETAPPDAPPPSDAPRSDGSADGPVDTTATVDKATPDSSVDPSLPFSTPKAVAVLNSPYADDDPTLTGNMLEIYFNRSGEIWRSTRSSLTAQWSTPQVETTLSSSSGETNPEMLPDGLTIYLASSRTHPDAKGDYDIYISTRSAVGQPWSTPVPVKELNTVDSDHPGAPTPDGLRMIIVSDRSPSLGSHDLFLSTRSTTTGVWSAPQHSAVLSSSEQETSPWIDASARVVYLSSRRHGNPLDIWISTRSSVGAAFATPVALPSLNTSDSDADPWLSPDLRTIYFASNRNGDYDIFVAQR